MGRPPYYSQRAVFASPLSAFSFNIYTYVYVAGLGVLASFNIAAMLVSAKTVFKEFPTLTEQDLKSAFSENMLRSLRAYTTQFCQ